MASDHLLLTSSDTDGDFSFAFNNVTFSDRLLRIEIVHGGEIASSSVVDCVSDLKRKREEEDVKKDSNVLDLATNHHMDFDLNKNLCETNYDDNNKKDEEAMVMAEQESKSGSGELNNNSIMRVKELHISSAVLAAKSPFFYKLFSINGMLESDQKHLTIKIDASEESAVMELLEFMYSNSLSTTMVPALLDILIVADKFQVASCMKYISCFWLKMPMTLDSALLLLDLPSNLLMADSVKPLANAARTFLATRYKDISKYPIAEVMVLPLAAFKVILSSNEIQIASEDIMYEVVLKWVKLHYSTLEERRKILGSHLARFIRFPHMTTQRLKKILTEDDFTPSAASKIVLEALLFKAESLHRPVVPPVNQIRFVERIYKYKPIKIVQLEAPRHQCIVYLDLKRKECETLYPSGGMHSNPFHLCGESFFLSMHCNMDQQDLFRCFGFFLAMENRNDSPGQQHRASENSGPSLTVEYEFSARSKPTEDFELRHKGSYKFFGGKAIGYKNLFAIPWDYFMDKDCSYFINDVLHLRVELSALV